MFYLWIPIITIVYALSAILSKKANDSQDWKWVWILYSMNLLGMWPFISKYSKNLIRDGLIYDLVIFLSFYFTLLFLGAAKNFTTTQWIASILIFAGLLLFKLDL